MKAKDIIFINSHPIQYFTPLYKYMNKHGIKTSAWYCSDASTKTMKDQGFGVDIKWDINLLDGYEYRFFKNASWKPSHFNGFFGLINLGMIKELFRTEKSIFIVHGWHYFTLLAVLLLARFNNHVVCLRCDVPYNHEKLKKGVKQAIKRLALTYIVFPRVNYFLYIGTQNKLFYQSLNVPTKKLISCPYAVDNDRFRADFFTHLSSKDTIKQDLGISLTAKIIVYSAKYIKKKRPLDLMEAFKQLNNQNTWLLMVGEGQLRGEMEDYINQNNLKNVILTGFVNQSNISAFYTIGDVFVMCSSMGENWGLSVNEAMNFNMPLVISDMTGCADDLVKNGANGYIFKTGDIGDLTNKLRLVLEGDISFMPDSKAIINHFSFGEIVNGLKQLTTPKSTP